MKTDLTALEKYLTEDISPEELASLLDELLFDYSQIVIYVHETENNPYQYIHEEASSFLYHLKKLRDALRKCKVNT